MTRTSPTTRRARNCCPGASPSGPSWRRPRPLFLVPHLGLGTPVCEARLRVRRRASSPTGARNGGSQVTHLQCRTGSAYEEILTTSTLFEFKVTTPEVRGLTKKMLRRQTARHNRGVLALSHASLG